MEHLDRNKIKAEIDATICPMHNEHPELLLTDNGNFQIKTCCDSFQEKCVELLQQLIVNQTGDHIAGMFDNLFD